MKNLNKFLLYSFIIAITFITSCTTTQNVNDNNFVQKRKYNKGFHVNKSKDSHKENTKQFSLTEEISNEKTTEQKQEIENYIADNIKKSKEEIYTLQLEGSNERIVTKQSIKYRSKLAPKYFASFDFIKVKKGLLNINIEPDNKEDTRRIHRAATKAFVLGALSLLGETVGILSFYVFKYLHPLSLALMLPILLIIPTIILSIIAMIKIDKEPEKYKGGKLAVFALLMILVVFMIFGVYITSF